MNRCIGHDGSFPDFPLRPPCGDSENGKLVINGPDIFPGVNYIVRPDGVKIRLDFVEDRGPLPDNKKYNKELEKALKEIDKGDTEEGKGKLDKAIHHYQKAWEKAQKAIKAAT
jgi:hypothetical protein